MTFYLQLLQRQKCTTMSGFLGHPEWRLSWRPLLVYVANIIAN